MHTPDHTTFIGHDFDPSWARRLEQARGTSLELAALLSIAAEAESKGDEEVHCAAHDAAHSIDPVERGEFIAELERLFDEANEHDSGWALDPDFLRDERAEMVAFGLGGGL